MAIWMNKEFKERMFEALELAKYVKKVGDDYYVVADEVRFDLETGVVTLRSNGKDTFSMQATIISERDVLTLSTDKHPLLFPFSIEV